MLRYDGTRRASGGPRRLGWRRVPHRTPPVNQSCLRRSERAIDEPRRAAILFLARVHAILTVATATERVLRQPSARRNKTAGKRLAGRFVGAESRVSHRARGKLVDADGKPSHVILGDAVRPDEAQRFRKGQRPLPVTSHATARRRVVATAIARPPISRFVAGAPARGERRQATIGQRALARQPAPRPLTPRAMPDRFPDAWHGPCAVGRRSGTAPRVGA